MPAEIKLAFLAPVLADSGLKHPVC